jgi:pyridoxal phosphate enzyme (YggS family)
MSIADNVAGITKRVDLSAQQSNRDPQIVTLMAVTKTISADRIREAYNAGIRVFGENRVQEFVSKADALRSLPEAEWHLIGHLQSNKSAKATELFGHVDSLDSIRLAEKLNTAASQLSKKLSVLIEINIGGERVKSGIAPDSPELERLLGIAPELSSLEFRGLMTVPPYNDDPEQSRPYFRRMRALFERVKSRNLQAIRMDVLSMGMSQDFEVAIEEGSTCVRVGTAIFGERAPQAG